MNVRKATRSDLGDALRIYSRAREFMKSNANPTQWGSNYPPAELVERDIAEGLLYVVEDKIQDSENGFICGVFAFFPSGDSIYNNIEGKWLNDLPHAAIHRVASSGERKGVLAAAVDFCLSVSKNLKIDTHADNLPMQNALSKLGFVPCGRIFLENGEERIAYQRWDVV